MNPPGPPSQSGVVPPQNTQAQPAWIPGTQQNQVLGFPGQLFPPLSVQQTMGSHTSAQQRNLPQENPIASQQQPSLWLSFTNDLVKQRFGNERCLYIGTRSPPTCDDLVGLGLGWAPPIIATKPPIEAPHQENQRPRGRNQTRFALLRWSGWWNVLLIDITEVTSPLVAEDESKESGEAQPEGVPFTYLRSFTWPTGLQIPGILHTRQRPTRSLTNRLLPCPSLLLLVVRPHRDEGGVTESFRGTPCPTARGRGSGGSDPAPGVYFHPPYRFPGRED